MSGGDRSTNSGAGIGYGSGGGGGKAINCANLFEDTVLNSPSPQVLQTLTVGDILQVAIHPSQNNKILVAVTANGSIAGSITSRIMTKIQSCINDEGYSYVAVVTSIQGGACRVQIRPQ